MYINENRNETHKWWCFETKNKKNYVLNKKLMLQNWTFSAFNGDIFKKKIKRKLKNENLMFKTITSLTNKQKPIQ